MANAQWTYLSIPLSGATVNLAREEQEDHEESAQVYALRVSASGLAEAMLGSGKWVRLGQSIWTGWAHEKRELSISQMYYYNGDL